MPIPLLCEQFHMFTLVPLVEAHPVRTVPTALSRGTVTEAGKVTGYVLPLTPEQESARACGDAIIQHKPRKQSPRN